MLYSMTKFLFQLLSIKWSNMFRLDWIFLTAIVRGIQTLDNVLDHIACLELDNVY